MENNIGNILIEEPKERFKRVNLSIIQNNTIDCLTLGIYVKILTLGKTWQLNIKGLSSILDISDNKIRKSISILEKEGYMSRHSVKNSDGKFIGWNYKFYSEQISINDRTCAGKRTSQKTDTPLNGQHQEWTTPKTDNTENEEENIYRLKETIDLKDKEENVCSWRESFDNYLSLVNEAKYALLEDQEFYDKMNVYYPNADYDKTIDKMVSMFWGTEAGWHNKKSKRSKNINMLSTLKNNYSKNIVYKVKGQTGRIRLEDKTDENIDSSEIDNNYKWQW